MLRRCTFSVFGFGVVVFAGSCLAQQVAPNPLAVSHKGVFYANDFSYLKAPGNDDFGLGDGLKLMPVADGDFGSLDIGGQIRERYHHERGMGRVPDATVPFFEDTEADFFLTRLRLYSNWKVCDELRFYCEGIYADATDDNGEYAQRPIDENFGDLLNCFADIALTDTTTIRVGRQELLYGAQRLVSPLDWANTRRTFEGANLLYRDGNWAIDSFYTMLVPVQVREFDEGDDDIEFFGSYAVYSGFENFTVDFYYLGYDNGQAFNNDDPLSSDFLIHTTGIRINGAMDNWLWELEGGPQFGEYDGAGVDHSAGFATAGIGRSFIDAAWKPTVWLYYDYASGNVPGGDFNGFNQLFPLGHKYFGFIDAVQRSNILAPNCLVTAKPTDRLTVLMWYWHFTSDSEAEVPSIVAANTPAQNTEKDLGDELDVLLTYTICPRSSLGIGWSHFWRGDKIILSENDADFVYSEWTMNF